MTDSQEQDRPQTMPIDEFLRDFKQADPALREELAEMLTETRDDLDDPWG